MKAVLLAVVVIALAVPAVAQQVEIRATPPPVERPDFIVPGPYNDVTEPRENDWYGGPGVRVPYDPAFIEPLSQEYESPEGRGRVGVAGWTSQNLPVGPSGLNFREQAGWLSFGFGFTWGAPPRTPRPAGAPQPAPAQRR
ncbi:MAG TPA: hypothetical protein VEA38_07815 [Terriglobales bacterium]|nr:hypothetical protein [Terriglobales bacterium]